MLPQTVRTLLIVDDEKDIRDLIANDVRDALGYEVVCAADGQEGLEVLTGQTVDAVLCDIRMPRLSGMEMLAELRKSSDWAPPFAFLTGYQSEEQLLKAVQLGAVDFLRKPFTREDLHSVVERLLDMGSRRRAIAGLLEAIEFEHPETGPKLRELSKHLKMAGLLQSLGTSRPRR